MSRSPSPFYDGSALERLTERRERAFDASDIRTRFAHDRDRVLYSSAFRRLAGKSQVVAAGELGLYHTRLTHSLKVAQLGRRLAERLQAEFHKRHSGEENAAPPDAELIEAACLAHDLGHPPFGHAGEVALGDAFDEAAARSEAKEQPDRQTFARGGFEGNAQTFRILTYLAARRPLRPRSGLNLTLATLDAATKYPCLRVHGRRVLEKWGAFELDRSKLDRVRRGEPVGPDAAKSFEAEVMDWCDDVTFAVHDLVDFYRGGFIPLERFFLFTGSGESVEISEPMREFLRRLADDDPDRWPLDVTTNAWKTLAGVAEVYDPWEASLEGKALAQAVTSQLITHFVRGVTYEGDAPCLHLGRFLIDADRDTARLKRVACGLLKKLLWRFVIERPQLASQQHGQREIVKTLFAIYHQNAQARMYHEDTQALLPRDRQQDLEDHGDVLRVVADHVASLTEEEAGVLFRRLTGTRLGAITEAV